MFILSISTSSNICSVALLKDNSVISELNIDDDKTHSVNLMPLINQILTSNNLKISDIGLITCDNGPGSFTGIRIGISTAKGLSYYNNMPIITITSLEALAYNVSKNNGYICSLIDARNNQLYCGIFDNNYNLCEDYISDDVNNVIHILNKYNDVTFVGNGASLNDFFLNKDYKNIDVNIHSKNIGIAGYKRYRQNMYNPKDSILPIYLRPSQAERMHKKDG